MKKLIFIFLISVIVSLRTTGQSVVPSLPRPATLGRPVEFAGPGGVAPGVKLPGQFTPGVSPGDIYLQDRNTLRNRQEAAWQMIEEDMAQVAEMRRLRHMADDLIRNGFPSWDDEPGAAVFRYAYRELQGMLADSLPLNLARAVFLTENAFLDNRMDYEDFDRAIAGRAKLCEWKLAELGLDAKNGVSKNGMIYSLLTDTLSIKAPGSERVITHLPVGKREVVGQLLVQLGRYYLVKYGYDPFILKCTATARQYSPYPVDGLILEADYQTKLTLRIAELLNTPNPEALKQVSPEGYKHYERMHELYRMIDRTGYEETPPEIYQAWLNHIDKEKEKERMRKKSAPGFIK